MTTNPPVPSPREEPPHAEENRSQTSVQKLEKGEIPSSAASLGASEEGLPYTFEETFATSASGVRIPVWDVKHKGFHVAVCFGLPSAKAVCDALNARSSSEPPRNDARRLDWLEAQIPTDVAVNLYATHDGKTIGLFCMAVEAKGDSLRAAIDDGMSRAASPPEEATK